MTVLDVDATAPASNNQAISTGVCAICKNELPYILEWIFYQKLVGFDKIYIYDNDSDDGTSEALIRLHEAGEIIRIYWPRLRDIAPQRSAYANFLELYAGLHDWVLICDLDEFLCLDIGNVKDFIAESIDSYPAVSAIAIPWLVFGASGHESESNDLVINRFTHCEEVCDGAVKTLFRPDRTYNIRTHIVDIVSGFYLDNNGMKAKWSNAAPTHLLAPSFGKARIHHYFTKSKQEWEKRKSLGRADRSDIQLRNLALFDRYEDLNGRNKQLCRFSKSIKKSLSLHPFRLGQKLAAEVIFRNDSFIVLGFDVGFESSPRLRVVLNDSVEIHNCKRLELFDGLMAVSINLTGLPSVLKKIRLSDLDGESYLVIKDTDFSSRRRMLKLVLRKMPSAEMIKFNLFKRISRDADGCDYLSDINMGDFEKFLEYQDFIILMQQGNFSKLTSDQVKSYLEKHARMGQAVLDAFNHDSHYISSLLPDDFKRPSVPA
ncbi:glycosyltransferase family 2 protein [Halomonas sp. MC140]|nr:glycosyltransferase family 2 protein [Halomonas sp. MC140]MDN7131956.1 glycosyltransferase family 2 protein [Halomonas sp. MC140]